MARLGLQLLVMTLVLEANFIHINQESHANNLNSTRGIRLVKLPAPVTVSLLILGPGTVEINQARAVIRGRIGIFTQLVVRRGTSAGDGLGVEYRRNFAYPKR